MKKSSVDVMINSMYICNDAGSLVLTLKEQIAHCSDILEKEIEMQWKNWRSEDIYRVQ